ncbi:MAG: DUF6029 family protein, partial [Hymenobacteraceae bacterium]|nr:DUF6029 family protein [Hymenobacteraceae bacterium]MDX5396952.1 DUF6029 family protein [Hymenobacteraceae bacterium]MDX5443323.1 DUF6029 family protein [Hymenobacteraceae bacterium]MDX5513026.1 DUF6029 family protein [Hymenobacteraceae bacterium]
RFLLVGLAAFALLQARQSQAQSLEGLEVHGDFQIDAQYYREDSVIGAPKVPESVLMNAYGNFIITYGNFSAGARYEAYLNPLQGFDPRYKGSGIPYRYLSYSKDGLSITAGSFYEQFGNGLIFRSYEERGLGLDNAMDGLRIRFSPYKGVYLKGVYGRQRQFFELSPAIVRGADAEVQLNEVLPQLAEAKTRVIVGGSFISKFQEDNNPTYVLPENVAASAARVTINRGAVSLNGEYAYKINDPSQVNNYIYKNGESVLLTASYSQKGLGVIVGAKRVDNMDFRSDRNATGNVANINFLPALTKQHTSNLAASMAPSATQPMGEMSYQAEVSYQLPRNTWYGGQYGTQITVNYSKVKSLDKTALDDDSTARINYKSNRFEFGDELYFRDFNIEITRKFSRKTKATVSYLNLRYNKDVVQGLADYGIIDAHIGIADVQYKITPRHIIRTEAQGLFTKQDMGSWAMGLVEYTFAPRWFVAVMDQYNYGNPEEKEQVHYFLGSVGYNKHTSRVQLSYGRQRAGIVCVGGVCRNVPASNGLTLSISSSF